MENTDLKKYIMRQKQLLDAAKPAQDAIEQFNRSTDQRMNKFKAEINKIVEPLSLLPEYIYKLYAEQFGKLGKALEDFDINEYYKRKISEFMCEKENYLHKFASDGIFPPILFFIDSPESIYNIENVNEFIISEDVKEYYKTSIKDWSKKENSSHANLLVKEIKENYEKNNIFSVTISIFVLMEYRIRHAKLKNPIPTYSGSITSEIRNALKESVFELTDSKFLYNEFANPKGDSDIFKNTEKATDRITRNILHGERLDLVTEESMMSVIFIYDYIDNILKHDNCVSVEYNS